MSALGVTMLLDQPLVGQNLQDHALVPLIYAHSQPISMIAAMTPENAKLFAESGRGPLTSNGPEAGGYIRTRPGLPGPDAGLFAAPVMFTEAGLGVPTGHAISCGPTMVTPQSRGSVLLASADPTAKPRIATNFFSVESDLDDAVAAVRVAMEIARQEPMAPYTETLLQPPASESDADLRDYARRYTHSLWHPAGTCAMGAVTDAELRVQGVEGLRVADASVMPTVGRGNPNATVIAIGEKAADLVRGVPAPVPATAALAG